MRRQNTKSRERAAADAYLNFLQSKGADSRTLYLRSHLLDTLIVELEGKEQIRLSFANAIKKVKPTLSKEDLSIALSTSREYFPFWMDDYQAIAAFEKNYGFSTKNTSWKPKPKSAKSIESAVKANIFTHEETVTMTKYKAQLLKTISDVHLVDEWLHYTKILLVRLRDAPCKDHQVYRTAIDLTINLFKDKSSQKSYLNSARKFYKFWHENQNTMYSS